MENLEETQIMKIKSIARDHILPFLPAKSLTRFRAVAVEWNDRIESPLLAFHQSYDFKELSGFFCQQLGMNPRFISLDHEAYGVPDPSLTFLPGKVCIISSCSGLLLCQQTDGNDSFYICNPANKMWKELPRPTFFPGAEPAMILAFDPCPQDIEGDYSIISAVPMLDCPTVEFEIYSSKTQSWRLSDTILVLEDSRALMFKGNMLYLRGIAYWETSRGTLLAFDLKNESYDIIPLPSKTSHPGAFGQVKGEPYYASIVPAYRTGGYAIKIYNLAQQGLRHVINVKFEGANESVPRVLPGFDGKTVMIHMGFFIYSCCAADTEAPVVTGVAFDSQDPHKYLQYVNSLVQVT